MRPLYARLYQAWWCYWYRWLRGARFFDFDLRRKSRRVDIGSGSFVWYHPRVLGIWFPHLGGVSLYRNGEFRTGRWVTYLVRKA